MPTYLIVIVLLLGICVIAARTLSVVLMSTFYAVRTALGGGPTHCFVCKQGRLKRIQPATSTTEKFPCYRCTQCAAEFQGNANGKWRRLPPAEPPAAADQ